MSQISKMRQIFQTKMRQHPPTVGLSIREDHDDTRVFACGEQAAPEFSTAPATRQPGRLLLKGKDRMATGGDNGGLLMVNDGY